MCTFQALHSTCAVLYFIAMLDWMDTKTFLMVGRPGSGKGTQARLLAEKINAPVFSTGNEFRTLAAGETYLGKRLKGAMEAGELLPHWLASYIFEHVLFSLEPEQKIVFEGACRTEPESILFHEISQWLNRPYRAVYLKVNEDEVYARLVKRHDLEGRADDGAEVIKRRFEEYKKKNEAVIESFRSAGTLVEVNGEQPIEAVHAEILQALNIQ
jgi:adenylate kinase